MSKPRTCDLRVTEIQFLYAGEQAEVDQARVRDFRSGKAEEGLAQIQQGIATWRAAGIELVRPYFSSMMVEALRELGRIDEGLAVLNEELDMMEKTGEKHYEAELQRLKSELMLMQEGDPVEIEACLQKAIDISRRQQAKSQELRAAVSLSRLWQKQGKEKKRGRCFRESTAGLQKALTQKT